MRTRKDIERDKKNISEAQQKLLGDKERLAAQEEALLQKLGEDILSGNALTDDLSALRTQKEATEVALRIAEQKRKDADQELETLNRAEIAGQWYTAEKDLRTRVKTLRELIGSKGVKGELDKLYAAAVKVRPAASHASQDAEAWTTKVMVLWTQGSQALYEVWGMLDALENQEPQRNQRDSNGEIVDFGKMP